MADKIDKMDSLAAVTLASYSPPFTAYTVDFTMSLMQLSHDHKWQVVVLLTWWSGNAATHVW